MALFFFLVIQIVRSPGKVKGPNLDVGKLADMFRDPNLDGRLGHCEEGLEGSELM